MLTIYFLVFFFSSRRRHTRLQGDWSSDVCSSDLASASGSRAPSRPTRLTGTDEPVRREAESCQATSEGSTATISMTSERSEERRVGKECNSRRLPYSEKKNTTRQQ